MSVTLTAEKRDRSGKSAARSLRRSGRVPAVVYGHGDETRSLSVNTHELQKLLSSISVENTIIALEIKDGESTQALIREVQYHPTRSEVLHLDLYQIHAGEKIHLTIPVRLHGNPVGVRDEGGVLQQILHELNVECLPRHIPEGFDIDIENLAIGDSVHIRDIDSANVKILNDEELTICSVAQPTVVDLPEDAVDEDAPAGDIEPELIGDRDKESAESE
ncbi:50S ribosomal protein L25 [soil metagenome]